MATTTATVAPNNATAAEFRAWAQFVHDVFANGSWVQTADTGQINLTTVAAPGAANTKQGYEVWRMDDAHQAAAPLYLKIAYGSGTSTNFPALWFMLGTASDGAGNLIDTADGNRAAYLADFYTQTTAPIASRGNSATTHVCFGSADTDRAVFTMFESKPVLTISGALCDLFSMSSPDTSAVGNFVNVFSIERGRDVNGDTTPDHVLLMWSGTSTNGVITHSLYLKTSDKWVIASPQFGLASGRPPGIEAAYTTYKDALLPASGAAAAYAIIPFEQNAKPAWPGVNLLLAPHSLFEFDPPTKSNCTVPDVLNYVSGRTASVDPYGVARTYRTSAGLRASAFGSQVSDTGAYVWMLYE